MKPRIVLNYGIGSASPSAIAAAARGKYDLTWLCDLRDTHSRAMVPILSRLGTVVTGTGGSSLDERAAAIAAYGPVGIVTFCDTLVWDTAQLARKIGLPYHTPHTARAVTDKYVQRQVLAAAGLQDISFRRVKSRGALINAVCELRRPVVVKPLHGQGSRNTFRIRGPADLKAMLATVNGAVTRGFIVEEELPGIPDDELGPGVGDYVSVETVTVRGRHHVAGVVGRLTLATPFRERGWFYPSTLDASTADEVRRLVLRALTALGIRTGVTHTEVKLTPHGAEIIEVNGRLGGHVSWLIGRHGGPDLIDAALQASLDRVQAGPASAPRGVAFRHAPPAPMRVGVVEEVTGLREVRGMACVETVEVKVRRGMMLDWREGTGSCLAEISGVAGSHQEMVERTDRIERLLQVSLVA